MSVTRITLPPRCAGGVYKITQSGTGSCVNLIALAGSNTTKSATMKSGRMPQPRSKLAFSSGVVPRWPVGVMMRIVFTRSRLLQRQSHQRVRAGLSVEIAARGDDLLELRRRDRQPRNDLADAARLLVEVPDELAPGGLLRVALAVLREDRDARTEERHLVRGDQLHTLHEVEHLGRLAGARRSDVGVQHR